MLYLCDDLLKLIFNFIDLRCLYDTIRLVNHQWAKVSNDERFWQSVSLKGKHNDTDRFLRTYESKIKYLQIAGTSWTRRNSFTWKTNAFDIFRFTGVFSNSIVDDKFCEILSNAKSKV